MKLATAVTTIFTICVALPLTLATVALAQQYEPWLPSPSTPPFPSTLTSPDAWASVQMPDPAQGLISLDVSVTDNAGKPVSGLTEKDFTLLDNNRQQQIVTFQAIDGAIAKPANSLEIVLVIDELNMLTNPHTGKAELTAAVREVENFLQANGGILPKPTIVYRLAPDGLFATRYVSMDGNQLVQEIRNPVVQRRIWAAAAMKPEDAGIKGNNAVASRIAHSLVALGSIAVEERRKPGRKLLFWIGNGWQTDELRPPELPNFSVELLTRLREARITLWSASEWPLYAGSGKAAPVPNVLPELLQGPKVDPAGIQYLSLAVIATRTGGGELNTTSNLAALLAKCVAEEATHYLLTFDPPRTSVVDEYHHLNIQLNQPGLTARVFEDYYDQPVFYDQVPPAQSLSVQQLQTLIAGAHRISDAQLARQLDSVRLTERLSDAKLATLKKSVRGKKSREALELLADKSSFFAPPDDEIIAASPPEIAVQRQIVTKILSYINSTIPRLPDFLATRTSLQYYQFPARENETWKTAPADQSLHLSETAKSSIRFSKGKEIVKDETVKMMHPQSQDDELLAQAFPEFHAISSGGRSSSHRTPDEQELKTVGVFGPILSTITVALTWTRSQVNWDHWERGDNGRLAVFRYHVTQGTPFFSAGFCCLPIDNKSIPFIQNVPFHGVIAVNPETGAIMRFTIESDLGWRLPLERSDLMIEYGPVQGESRVFVCPSKSVSISRQRTIRIIHEWGEAFKVYAPFETDLNEMRFENYHVFGSTSRILPSYVEAPKTN